jgi:EAL domain-containing protein (putative c-di-GMP-specific phosphodiesterase class I)
MKLGDKVRELIESGVPPIVLHYEPIRFFSSAETVLRSFLIVNSLELGTLTMNEYRFVARRTKQGDHLVQRHLVKLCREIPKILATHKNVSCFTVPVYARLLREGILAKMLMETLALFPAVSPASLCVELSADILYEDIEEAAMRISELRAIGVKVAIAEVGDEFCPVFRLTATAFDYAFLDRYATNSLLGDGAERIAGSLVNFLHYLKVKVVAPLLDGEEQIASAEAVGCDGYTLGAEPMTEGVRTDA